MAVMDKKVFEIRLVLKDMFSTVAEDVLIPR